ncbi:MAG: tetratricopeptide repeat protein [Nitrospirae bacterium]|nr:tetratricopeptide repeat protein [Nitrospirota bacterium]
MGLFGGLFGGRKAPEKAAVAQLDEAEAYTPSEHDLHLAGKLDVHPRVVSELTRAVNGGRVPKADRDARLREQVGRHKELAIAMADAAVPDDVVAELVNEARDAFAEGDYEAARNFLDDAAIAAVGTGRADVGEQGNATRCLAAAHFKALNGRIERVLLDPRAASERYQQALALTPEQAASTRANYLHTRGMCDFEAGDLSKAEAALSSAVTVLKKAHGLHHREVGRALCDLGDLYLKMGRTSAAENHFRDGLSIYERAYGENAIELTKPLALLAELYSERGILYRAEPYLHRQIDIIAHTHGRDSHLTAEPLRRLAALYLKDGKRVEDAVPLLRMAIANLEHHHRGGHPDIANCRIELGRVFEALHNPAQAETLYTQAVALRDQLLGDSHPDVAEALLRVAGVYLAQNKTTEAKGFLGRALDICDAAQPGGSATSGEALAMLAEMARQRKAYADAAPLFRRAVTTLQRALGGAHPLLAETLENFARLHADQGREMEAEATLAEARKVRDAIAATA